MLTSRFTNQIFKFSSHATKLTPLFELHQKHEARFFDFNGWKLPFKYDYDEYWHFRKYCALWDVSHMSQIQINGPESENILEAILVSDLLKMKPKHTKLSLITNNNGGIQEDLLISKLNDSYILTCNAVNYQKVKNLLPKNNSPSVRITDLDYSLISLQGPYASKVLPLISDVKTDIQFMTFVNAQRLFDCKGLFYLTRCGYTGVDGFEIAIPKGLAVDIVNQLLNLKIDNMHPVKLAGFQTRDIVRIEAGLCLYGNEIDESITPVQAGLAWTIGKRRLQNLDFPGAAIIKRELITAKEDAKQYVLMGFVVDKNNLGKNKTWLPRKGDPIYNITPDAAHSTLITPEPIGYVTSGTFSPYLNNTIAMGYIQKMHSQIQSTVYIKSLYFNRYIPYIITQLPFVPHQYYK